MANHVSHAALPYPVKGARYTVPVPYLDADGDPTDPTTPDTERSIDGAAFADCAEEVTTITGSNGAGFLTLTGAETDCSLLVVVAKVASGPKATILTAVPRVLPSIATGTAQAGADGSITLASGASATSEYYTGCIVKTTGGTGGGGTGGESNQARVITAYNGSTKVATVVPNWETNPSNDTTYAILLTENAYCLLANAVQVGGTAQTGRDLGASVLLSSGTGTGQISLSSGAVTAGTVSDKTGYSLASAPPSAATIASQVRTELTTELGRIDAAVSTRSTLDAAGIRTAVGLASANLDTQLDALPTAVEVVTALGTGSTLTAIPWNAAWDAEVQSECTDALNAYDPPTAAELTSAVTAVKLASDGLDAVVIETGVNARQAMSVVLASAAGVLSGAATTSIAIKGGNVATTRIAATVDSDGNRSAVTL